MTTMTVTSCWNELCEMFLVNVCHARLSFCTLCLVFMQILRCRCPLFDILPFCLHVLGGFDKWFPVSLAGFAG